MDLKRAYDSIDRAKLWKVMVYDLNIPQELIEIIRNMYVDSNNIVVDKDKNDFYQYIANMGVK
jgi:hypothetical protein